MQCPKCGADTSEEKKFCGKEIKGVKSAVDSCILLFGKKRSINQHLS